MQKNYILAILFGLAPLLAVLGCDKKYSVAPLSPQAPTFTATPTWAATPSHTFTLTASPTLTQTPVYSFTLTPTESLTPFISPTATFTRTPTNTDPTLTPTWSSTPTWSWTPTFTRTPTTAYTPTPTITWILTVTPVATCSSPGYFGYNGSTYDLKEYYVELVAGRYDMTVAGIVYALAADIWCWTGSGQARLGLYTSDALGNRPVTLLTESAPFTAIDGWNTVDVPNVFLSPGKYWISVLYENTYTSPKSRSNSGTSFWNPTTWGGPFPAVMPSGGGTGLLGYNVRAYYCP